MCDVGVTEEEDGEVEEGGHKGGGGGWGEEEWGGWIAILDKEGIDYISSINVVADRTFMM